MKSKSKFLNLSVLFSLFAGMTLLLAACAPSAAQTSQPTTQAPQAPSPTSASISPTATAPPTQAPAAAPTATQQLVPSVTVEDQAINPDDGIVIVPEAVSPALGWVVIHADDNGQPGDVIGYRAVHEGVNKDLIVPIDVEAATPRLYAMLHLDLGQRGKFEFPGVDKPVTVNGQVVVKSFQVTGLPEPTPTPSVTVENQPIKNGTVTVADVVSDGPGWIVIHRDEGGAPGTVIGYAAVESGDNQNVQVEVDVAQATDTLYAMLHTDAGQQGTYEFPGADSPVEVDGEVVVQQFIVTGKAQTSAETQPAEVQMVGTTFQPADITVAAGTTVVWTNTSDLPHTVTADDGSFDSGTINPGETFSHTFDTVGNVPYHCQFHGDVGGQGMSGTVTVQ